MKKVIVMTALVMSSVGAMAQNLQVHYDFGHHLYSADEDGRQSVTMTFEQFKADKLGSWYYFIDLDADKDGIMGAYTEISREFSFAKATQNSMLAAHVEYDGGMNRFGSFQTSALLGAAWNLHSSDFSKTFSLQVMYKQFFKQNETTDAYASFQITGVWGVNFAGGKGTFSGFADLWRGKDTSGDGNLVFLTEPQLWYNFNSKFSVGAEVEVSNNFIYYGYPSQNDKFFVNPTLAVKYNF